jgi:hypothetical protein
MVYLIGLDHETAQRHAIDVAPGEFHRQFEGVLQKAINDIHPVLIAEEESEENRAMHHAISIAKEVAVANGIEHRFCSVFRKQMIFNATNLAERVESGW